MTSREQKLSALERANAIRSAKVMLRKAVKAGEVTMGDVLADPPACLAGVLLFDVLLMGREFGSSKLMGLNRRAVLAGVNLAVPVDRASVRTRRWVADDLAGVQREELAVIDASPGGEPTSVDEPERAPGPRSPSDPLGGDFKRRRARPHARRLRPIGGRLVA